jgi:hypothetical protein
MIIEAHQARVGDTVRKPEPGIEWPWATVQAVRIDYAITNGNMCEQIVHMVTEHGEGWLMGDVRLEKRYP